MLCSPQIYKKTFVSSSSMQPALDIVLVPFAPALQITACSINYNVIIGRGTRDWTIQFGSIRFNARAYAVCPQCALNSYYNEPHYNYVKCCNAHSKPNCIIG